MVCRHRYCSPDCAVGEIWEMCSAWDVWNVELPPFISVVGKTVVCLFFFSSFHHRVMREDTFSLLVFAGHLGHLEMCIVNFNVPLKWWGILNLGERGRGQELDSIWNLN